LWSAPFTNDGKTPMSFLSLGNGHFVRAAASCDPSEIAA
jgi:hypothetical protein